MITQVPLWWSADSGEGVQVWGQGVHGKHLHFLFNVSVNPKLP
jgi:hypothetical protein